MRVALAILAALVVSAPVAASETFTLVRNDSGRALPVLSGLTGEQVHFGNIPWFIQPSDQIRSHTWAGAAGYCFSGRCYHYIGSAGSPSFFQFFLVEQWGTGPAGGPVGEPQPAAAPSETVTNRSSEALPVLDGLTGLPVYLGPAGRSPWGIGPGQSLLSHRWGNDARYCINLACYHYIGSAGSPTFFRYFLAPDLPDGDNLLALVSKQQRLPRDFTPSGLVPLAGVPGAQSGMLLREVAAGPLRAMLEEAGRQGLGIAVASAFRSYEEQGRVYRQWVDVLGREQADRVSAQPGHSEHQLGTTVDLTSPSAGYGLTESFAGTPEGAWLRANAGRFGFVLSYPDGAEPATGYAFEPWHYRYVGVAAAEAIGQRGMLPLEFFREAARRGGGG